MNIEKLGVLLDCSRNAVYTVDAVKRLIDIMAKLGYKTLHLYTEDTLEIDGEPYFGYLRGRYTKAEIKALDAYALQNGIELIPNVQVLAHLDAIFRWEKYIEINDTANILLIDDEKTYAFIENIFKTLAETFTTRRVHIGMDEAYLVGRGKYFDRHGDTNRIELLTKHLYRVLEIAQKYGFKCQMWSDMFFHISCGGDYYGEIQSEELFQKSAETFPDNVELYYWDYYHLDKTFYDKMLDKHFRLTDKILFAGGAWTWIGFCPANDFSLETTKQAFRSCMEHGVKEATMTVWGDNGAEGSVFGILPTLVAASEFAKGNFDMDSIKKRFSKVVGMDFDLFCALDLPNKYIAEETLHNENHTKRMLYNDVFKGVWDREIQENSGAYFEATAKRLREGAEDPNWGYLFAALASLCDALVIKHDLGIRTRRAYEANDREALQKLFDWDYPEVLTRIEGFYESFRHMWMHEKKPHGFDVQDIRIGGLIMRIKHCRQMLGDYLTGKTDTIPELEETLLPFTGNGWMYHTISTPNLI